jgi:methionine aminopeptidase
VGAEPVFRTEEGFPGCINTSINDVAVHGVPDSRRLQEGDLLSIDASAATAATRPSPWPSARSAHATAA